MWKPDGLSRDGVAYMTNMPDGWPTLMNYYFSQFTHEIISISLSNAHELYPAYSYSHSRGDNQRGVLVLKEEKKWEFFQRGVPFEYEDLANYNKRKISDRLNSTIIKTYLERIGIYLDDERFWLPSAHSVLYSTDLIGAFG